jgi:ribosome maturation factor RimP
MHVRLRLLLTVTVVLASAVLASAWTTNTALAFQHLPPQRLTFCGRVGGIAPTATALWSSTTIHDLRSPSVVQDPDGPTPVLDPTDVETIDVDTLDELRDISDPSELPSPIPYQPWRRGETAGCEAPIAAEWRRRAEQEITTAVASVGGRVLDVTWFLTTVLITLDDHVRPPPDPIKDRGPVIEIIEPGAPVYRDPSDPEPDEIWADEDDVLYERETPEEATAAAERLHQMYATVQPDDEDPTESHVPIEETVNNEVSLYRDKETRDEVALLVAEEQKERHADSQQPMNIDTIRIDTSVLSTIAYAIVESLKLHEEEWCILKRHELLLSSPNPAKDALETQRQFDAYRNAHVVVETQDPWDSNRTLKGKLVDRNAMDVLLNIRGRLVTVPHNFVKCVRLSPGTVVSEYQDLVETEYIEDGDGLDEEDFDEEELLEEDEDE